MYIWKFCIRMYWKKKHTLIFLIFRIAIIKPVSYTNLTNIISSFQWWIIFACITLFVHTKWNVTFMVTNLTIVKPETSILNDVRVHWRKTIKASAHDWAGIKWQNEKLDLRCFVHIKKHTYLPCYNFFIRLLWPCASLYWMISYNKDLKVGKSIVLAESK